MRGSGSQGTDPSAEGGMRGRGGRGRWGVSGCLLFGHTGGGKKDLVSGICETFLELGRARVSWRREDY